MSCREAATLSGDRCACALLLFKHIGYSHPAEPAHAILLLLVAWFEKGVWMLASKPLRQSDLSMVSCQVQSLKVKV